MIYGAAGGASGGGVVNIFYQKDYINNGTISVAGGAVGASGGSVAGGNGYYAAYKISGDYL
jgi:hypothetical protein